MGRLTEEMTNLRGEIDALRNGRVEFIADLKHGMFEFKSDVADMQQGFRNDHTQMAGKLKDDLQMFVSGIKSTVSDLMDLFKNDRVEMAGNMKVDLQVFIAGIEEYIAALRDEAFDLQGNFHRDHAEMAGKLKNDLQMFVSGIKSTVSDLEKQSHNEHIELTGKARAERQIFFSNMKQSLDALNLKTADLLQDIRDDLAGAHKAWSGATPAGEKAAGKARSPAKVQAELEKVEFPVKDQKAQESTEEAPLKVQELFPDDLTEINGIGLAMSKHLNDAGIFTFAKLASSTIEEIRGALGQSAKFANFETWIKEAGKLSS